LAQFKERIVEGCQLIEFNDDDRTLNVIFSSCFNPNKDTIDPSQEQFCDEYEFLSY